MGGKALTLADAVSRFGEAAKARLTDPTASGEPEDQLRAPFEQLLPIEIQKYRIAARYRGRARSSVFACRPALAVQPSGPRRAAGYRFLFARP